MKRFRLIATYRGHRIGETRWRRVDEVLWGGIDIDDETLRRADAQLGGPPTHPMPVWVRVEFEDRVSPDAS